MTDAQLPVPPSMSRPPGMSAPDADSAFSWRFVTPLLVGSTLNPINSSLIATALISIAAAVHVPVGRTAILVSVLYLTSAVAQPAAGRLAETVGARRVFLSGLVLILAAALIGGLGSDLGLLIASRALLGVGTSTAYPSAMVLIRLRAARAELGGPPGNVLAGLAIAGQVTVAVGPSLGGLLLSAFGWRIVFLLNVPLALAALAMTTAWIPADVGVATMRGRAVRKLARRVDLAGIALFAAAMTTLILFIDSLPHGQWPLAAMFLIFGTALVWLEWRTAKPFLDLRLLVRNTRLTRTYLRAALSLLSSYIVLYGFTQWLEAARGLSASEAGLLLIPLGASAALISQPISRRNLVRGPLIISAFALLATGGLAFVISRHSPIWLLTILVLFVGISLGTGTVANQTALYAQAPADVVGTASGLLRTASYIGSIASASIIGSVFKTSITDAGLHQIAVIMIAVAAVLTVLTLADRHL